MDISLSFLSALPGIFFWSVVLSFIPNALYCIIKESRSHREEIASLKGVYIIEGAAQKRKQDMSYYSGIFIIYGICFVFFVAICMLNWFRRGQAALNPFDMLSSISVILFWLSSISYIPFMLYLARKRPMQYIEERARFNWIFIFYGICLLIFSIFYSYNWIKARQIPVDFISILSSFSTIVFCSTILAYLPILIYILISSGRHKETKVRFNVIFVIYSICFMIFSGIYVYNWIEDRSAGIELLTPQYFSFE